VESVICERQCRQEEEAIISVIENYEPSLLPLLQDGEACAVLR
jgi:hypothetical protein